MNGQHGFAQTLWKLRMIKKDKKLFRINLPTLYFVKRAFVFVCQEMIKDFYFVYRMYEIMMMMVISEKFKSKSGPSS